MQVKNRSYGSVYDVLEDATLEEVREAVPNFFTCQHGDDETIQMYRGFVIVQNSNVFGGNKPVQRAVVYLFTGSDTMCVSTGMELSDDDEATELIDEILESGEYGKAS